MLSIVDTAVHLRISRTKRKGVTYEYAQLVASERRASDGMPAHRVIGTLGALSSLEIDNLRAALEASRGQRRVVVAPTVRSVTSRVPDVVANLDYLDIAVGLELWREWALPEMFDKLLPEGGADVAPAAIIASLVLQRLVAPNSKLAATEWFGRTALPELLGIEPSQFNNTRLHRVLDSLDTATNELQAKLPRRYEEKEGAFVSMFLDVTDAVFVGEGPSFARRGRTKEGAFARKIGIVLLCNQRGYPLRWDVVPGTTPDNKTMLAMLESIAGLSWVGGAPVVCDRAMGTTATISSMSRLGLRFLTALTANEFANYSGDRLPHQHLARLQPSSSCDANVEQQAAELVTAAGMERVDDRLFVMDLGTVERVLKDADVPAAPLRSNAEVMVFCRRMLALVHSKEASSFNDARRKLGLRESVASRYRRLHKLTEELQQEVLAGRGESHSIDELLAVAALPSGEQRPRFDELLGARRRQKRIAQNGRAPRPVAESDATLRVRVVAYFNQERFVETRYRANAELAEIHAFVADLNERLARSGRRRSRQSVEAEVDRKLRAYDLVEAFDVQVHERSSEGVFHFFVEVVLDEAKWARRRRYDGFTLLAGHEALPQTAAQLCRLYRAKDVVEKDFHIIKSVLEVRPVRHHSDSKVRAHVTLCMLALLLERTLGQRTRGRCSAEAALRMLETCRLNQLSADDDRVYALTRPTVEQKELLRLLGMARLADAEEVAERIRPRAHLSE